MPSIFLDTGYFLALELANDQYHQVASEHWQRAPRDRINFVTTSMVLDEVVTFFNSKDHHLKAVSVGDMLLESSSIELVHVDESLLLDGWDYFKRHHDKRYSLTDCVSFVVMNRYGIRIAYAFDRNFIQAGYTMEPLSS